MKTHFSILILIFSFLVTACKKDNTKTDYTNLYKKNNPNEIKYKVDTDKSIILWTGFKPKVKHTGTLKLAEGVITLKNDSIVSGRFYFDLKSIAVTNLTEKEGKSKLEAHLKGIGDKAKSNDFFNILKFPSADFKLIKVEYENNKAIVYGNLSIKGITKAVNFPAEIKISNKEILIKSETLRLNRTYWDMKYASKKINPDLGLNYINDEVEVQVSVKADRI
ncbi:YceI family protein [Flavobacterium sp.]|uniref:YceI family protein n=1 Tax=Flavobacterium sp. TaxID=239 RepID=UPI003D0D47A4